MEITTVQTGGEFFPYVVSRTTAGGIAVNERSHGTASGRLLGYTVPGHSGWVACVRAGETWAAAPATSTQDAERLLRAELRMPPRPEVPCCWCAMDPESSFCCGGDHTDRHALLRQLGGVLGEIAAAPSPRTPVQINAVWGYNAAHADAGAA